MCIRDSKVDRARAKWEILDAFRDAAEAVGIPKTDDFNRGDNFGSSYFPVTQKNGLRCSAARAFLKPALKRPNLKLETGAVVEKIEIENGRAVAVLYRKAVSYTHLSARCSIFCACAHPSPAARTACCGGCLASRPRRR